MHYWHKSGAIIEREEKRREDKEDNRERERVEERRSCVKSISVGRA